MYITIAIIAVVAVVVFAVYKFGKSFLQAVEDGNKELWDVGTRMGEGKKDNG